MTARRRSSVGSLWAAAPVAMLLWWTACVMPAWGFATERVVYVVIDGPRDTEFFEDSTHANVPAMWNGLRPLGSVSHGLYNDGPTQTVPGHAMLGCGAFQNLPNDGSVRPTRPLLWEYLRDQRGLPDSAAVVVTGKSKLAVLSHSTAQGWGPADSAVLLGPFQSDSAVVTAFKTYALLAHPVIAMLCLSDVDEAAHSGSWRSYLHAIRTADSLVVALWHWLQATPPFAGVTAFVVTADHGRHDENWMEHGCACHGCRHLPLLACGPDFRVGVELWQPLAGIWDLAPTLGWLLGLETPLAQGRLLVEMLQGESVPPASPVVRITTGGNTLMLTWSPVTVDICGNHEIVTHYRVYRDFQPFFLASEATMVASAVSATQFVETDSILATSTEAVFYRVDAVDLWSNSSAASHPVGKIGFALME